MVYCNVKKGLLSIKMLEGALQGRVVAYAEQIVMKDVLLQVSQTGRDRVLRTRKKSVHAGAVGEIEASWGVTLRKDPDNDTVRSIGIGGTFKPIDGVPVHYNPYTTATFQRRDNGAPVKRANRLLLERCTASAEGVS